MMRYKVSDVREEEHLHVIEAWADSEVIVHTVSCLTLESAYGLERSIIYDLGHAVLYFSPRVTDIERTVTWYLDYFCKKAEKEQDEEERKEAEELLEDKAA